MILQLCRGSCVSVRCSLITVATSAVVVLASQSAWAAVSFSGDVTFTSSVNIGNTSLGTFRIDGGTSYSSNGVQLGTQTSGLGLATVTGAGSQWTLSLSNTFDVGVSGIGRLDILDGGVVNLASSGQFRIATNSSSHGTVVVDGLGSVLNVGSQLTLGTSQSSAGSAILRIANNAIVNVNSSQTLISTQGRVELDGGLLRTNQFSNNGSISGSGEVLIQATSATNAGRIEARAGDLLRITGQTVNLQNQGTIAADGGEIEFVRALTNTSGGSNPAEVTLRNGTIRAGSAVTSGAQFTNSSVLAALGGENDFYGDIANETGGRIAVTNKSVMIFHDDVTANGGMITVFPGASAIVLNNLTVAQGAVLLADLAGTNDNTGYGKIEVVGTANLAGALDVSLQGSYVPAAGNTFLLVTAGGIEGALTLGVTPALPATLEWDLDIDAHQVVLAVVPALDGDFNADGVVDAADYVVWRNTNGSAGHGLVADGNHDNTVDDADFGVWRANFGATIPGNSALAAPGTVVPEPAGIIHLAFGLFSSLIAHSHRKAFASPNPNRLTPSPLISYNFR